MATEATFTIPSDEFPLGSVFEHLPNARIELERVIPARDVVIPYFWVRGAVTEDIEAAFEEHPGVEDIRLVDSAEDEYLLRVEWTTGYTGVLSALTETDLTLIKGSGSARQWTFDVRGDDRNDIASFQRHCREGGIPIKLTKLSALTPIESDTESALTDSQQEALVLAYDRGYFNSPRDVTMAELGDELGISQQAVASRLRRGMKQILGRTLVDTTPTRD